MWRDRQDLKVRAEAHYGDRVVPCFTNRPAGLNDMMATSAANGPDRPALIGEEGRLSYAQLLDRSARIGCGLLKTGIAQGDRVVILIGNRFAFAEALLACWSIGAICAPINPLMRPQEVAFILNQCQAKAVIYDQENTTSLPPKDQAPSVATWLEAYGDGAFEALANNPPATPVDENDDQTTTLLYTSGTTGRPKGARLTNLSVIHGALQLTYAFQVDGGSRMLLASPASHVTGLVANIVAAWAGGGAVVMLRAFKAQKALELIETEKVTHSIMAPAMYQLCLLDPDLDKFDLSSWRCGAYGGAPMPETAIAALAARAPGLGLMNTYGATEASSGHTALPATMAASDSGSVGGVLHCSEILIADDDGNETPDGEIGEIWMKGGNVVPGYWDNPQADADNFIGGYWKSGDLGRKGENGLIYVMDRKKDMLNRGGYKIFSAEVENQLSFHPAVIECAIIAKPCDVLGERVRAIIVARDTGRTPEILAEDIQEFARERLSKYKVPEDVILRPEPLPRNANGKVLKNKLREEYSAT